MKKEGSIVFLVIVSIIIILPLTTAGLSPDFWKKITGWASSQPTNVSITVSGANPVTISWVETITAQDPVENNKKTISFIFTASDEDGAADIDITSGQAQFQKTGETSRQNLSCVSETPSGNQLNFTCSIDMWYWDINGTWTINVSANDLGNQTRQYNISTTFTYNLLKAMVISPNSLTWAAVSPGDTNQTSNSDPTTINNTGNYNSTIQLTGIDLAGETISTEYIHAGNFSVGINTGGTPPVECSGTTLVNATAATISNTIANRGNLSAGGGAGQEQLYYCIKQIPSGISSQTYSTSTGGSWTIAYP